MIASRQELRERVRLVAARPSRDELRARLRARLAPREIDARSTPREIDARLTLVPLPWGVARVFVSGAGAPADIRGLTRYSVDLGVSLATLSAAALDELLRNAGRPLLHVFVDSGAYSEKEGCPIGDAAWRKRLGVALRIAQAFGARAYVVAPDRVGDQRSTLARLHRYRDEIAAIVAAGSRLIVPLQAGALPAASFHAAAAEACGLPRFVVGIPENDKAAMPDGELETYLRAVQPEAVHLLGIGPRSPRLPAIVDMFRRLSPRTELSIDANTLAALVGHSNGPGGGERELTAWQEHFARKGSETPRADAVTLAFGTSRIFQLVNEELVRRGLMRPRQAPPLQLGVFDQAPR